MREFCGDGRLVSAVAASRRRPRVRSSAPRSPSTRSSSEMPDTTAADRGDPRAQGRVTRRIRWRCHRRPARTTARTASGRQRSPVDRQRHLPLARDRGGRACGGTRGGRVPDADDEDIGIVGKMTLRDGKWLMGDVEPENYSGTYEIVGDQLVFDWSGDVLRLQVQSRRRRLARPRAAAADGRRRRCRVGRRTVAPRRPARARHPLTRGQVVPVRSGSSTDNRVPPPGGAVELEAFRRAPRRDPRGRQSPLPSPGTAPPTPSSATSTRSRSARSPIEITTLEAFAYLTTFASASEQTK